MPARKGEISKVATNDDILSLQKESFTGLSIEDISLPKSIVTRLAKEALPPNTQIQANAMLGISKSATLFVNYIASQANENAASANRKTVNVNDVLSALEDSEFASWKPRLEAELHKYTEIVGQRKEKIRSRETETAPVAKKVKRDKGNASPNDKIITSCEKELDNKQQSDQDIDQEKDIGEVEINEKDEEEGEENLDDEQAYEQASEQASEEASEQESEQPVDEALDNGDDSD